MKLPLEETIVGGYRFLFTNIVSVIGTLWLPYLLLLILGLACGTIVLPPEVLHGDLSHFDYHILMQPQAHAARLLFFLANLVVGAMVTVNWMRHALGQKQTTTFVYFSLGAPVWRMVGAMILGSLVMIVVAIVLAIIGVVGGIVAFQHLDLAGAIAATIVLAMVLLLFLAYCFVRLFFFLPAVVVAGEHIGLERSWQLGGGNFWRIVIVWLLIAVPVWFVVGVSMQATVLPIILSQASQLPRHPTPEDVQPLIRVVINALPVMLPVVFVAGIAVRAFMAGAIGTAYNAVTAPNEDTL